MKLHQSLFGCVLLALTTIALPAFGQNAAKVEHGTAKGLLQNMPAGNQFTAPSAAELSALNRLRPLPMGEAAFKGNVLRAAAQATLAGANGTFVRPRANGAESAPSPQGVSGPACTTNVSTGFAPSDIHGAASPLVQVVVTNVDIGVYNRATCALISRVSLKTFFNRTSATETLFDPRVIFDKSTGRFFVTVESRDSTNTDQFQFFAVSTTNNASAFFKYTITLSAGNVRFCKTATNSFWDYPNVGSNARRWLITANDFGTTVSGALLDIDKAPTLTGGTVSFGCFAGLPSNIAPPIVLDSSTTATILSPGSGSGNSISRRDLVLGLTGPSTDLIFTRPSYPVPAWTSSAGGVQPNGQRLDALDGRFQSASIQSRGLLWNVHTINQSGFARARLYRLTNASTTLSPAPSLIFDPITTASDDIFNPSVATGSGLVNAPIFITATRTVRNSAAQGNAFMIMFYGPNASATDWVVSGIRYSGVAIATTNGVTSCNTSSRLVCRWGDYSATQVDPSSSGRGLGWSQVNPGPGTTQFDWATASGQVDLNLAFGPAQQAVAE